MSMGWVIERWGVVGCRAGVWERIREWSANVNWRKEDRGVQLVLMMVNIIYGANRPRIRNGMISAKHEARRTHNLRQWDSSILPSSPWVSTGLSNVSSKTSLNLNWRISVCFCGRKLKQPLHAIGLFWLTQWGVNVRENLGISFIYGETIEGHPGHSGPDRYRIH